jgi:hypothetical protein
LFYTLTNFFLYFHFSLGYLDPSLKMSGVQGQVLSHIVRRGVQHVVSSDAYQRLQQDAEVYEDAGSDAKVSPLELIPVLVTILVLVLITSSIQYTVGSVVASLTMIESPATTVAAEVSLPAYSDEPDAPLIKDDLLPSEAVADIEVARMQQTPVTASVRSTIRLLRTKAGFWSRWRGLRVSIVYHALHSYGVNASMRWFGMNPITHAIALIFFTVGFSLLHMTWTHTMISMPSQKPFWRRIVSYKNARPIILPNVVLAAAQLATYYLPFAVATLVDLPDLSRHRAADVIGGEDVHSIAAAILRMRFIAVPATFVLVAFCVLLPATVTLTRIEALLLPEGEDTIVPFDRQAILADVDMTKRGHGRALFVAAWRSFDAAARMRLIKVYAKMAAMQLAVVAIGGFVIFLQLYFIGFDRLALVATSGIAQLQLMSIEN